MTKKGYEAARAASRGPVKREEAEPGVSMTTYIVIGLLILVLLIFSILIFISF
jgi:ABC-type multidrug transport system permease subunit